MRATDQTLQQIERAIRKTADKFPPTEEASQLTDIHVRVTQETGELMTFDDDDRELTRCVVEQWIDNKDDDFYAHVTNLLRNILKGQHKLIDNMGIMKPYSFVLEDDEKENIGEIYLADDDTIILGGDIMPGLEDDLNTFFTDLMK